MDLESTELAFGRLPVGGSRCRAVSVSNRTPRTVTITRISTTCGCATGSVGHSVLAPGTSTELLVTAKPTREGRDAGSLFLVTDDPTTPQVVLSVSVEGFKPLQMDPAFVQFGDVPLEKEACVVALYGHVRGDLAATPASLLFLSVTPGSRPSRTVQLSSRGGRPLEILSLESDLASLSTRWELQAGGPLVITAVLDASVLRENASGTLLVRTGDATQPKLKIPVRVYLRR